jgi:hypothetical protein
MGTIDWSFPQFFTPEQGLLFVLAEESRRTADNSLLLLLLDE